MRRRRLGQPGYIGAGVALVLTGCQPQNPLVGKWQMTQTMFGSTITVTREFRPDGTESESGPTPGASDAEMTYSVAGNTLTESVTKMTINGNTVNIDPSKVPAGSPKSVTETFSLAGNTLTIANDVNGIQTTEVFERAPDQ